MKKLLNILCITLAVIFTLSLFSGCTPKESPVEDFEYKVHNDSTVSITKYIGTDKDVVIPSKIENLPVAVIDVAAFSKTNIASVVIPDSVVTISERSFSNCEQLKTVTFGSCVKYIEADAFSKCIALENALLPSSLETLGSKSFSDCKSIKKVFIPKSVISWQPGVFINNEALTDITIENGLKTIPVSSFYNCTSLQEITIPASIKNIYGLSFNECAALNKIIFEGNAPDLEGICISNKSNSTKDITVCYKLGTTGWDAEVWKKYTLVKQ